MRTILGFIIVAFCVVQNSASYPDPVNDPVLWDTVLQRWVQLDESLDGISLNTVDYVGMSNDTDFYDFVDSLATASVTNLTREEFYAFYINVYNALACHMIIKHACEKDLFGNCGAIPSIRSIGSLVPYKPVWGMDAGTVPKPGKTYAETVSLDDIESLLTNPPNGWEIDARLHSGIVCASISCPNLRKGAYDPVHLNIQLTENFNNFMSNTKKGMKVDASANTVHLSSIFNWFQSNFTHSGTVIDFIMQYLYTNHSDYTWLKSHRDPHLKYFNYNWNLNSKEKAPCDHSSRPCYQLWALLVTIGSLVIVAVIVLIVVIVVRRRRKARAGYTPIQ